jgi:hypothetical protein
VSLGGGSAIVRARQNTNLSMDCDLVVTLDPGEIKSGSKLVLIM